MKFLTIIQIGPVQDFIQTARRTDDYWAGSFLLSYAAANVIVEVEKKGGEIISPGYKDNQLIKTIRNNTKITGEALNPTIPNRVIAILETSDVNSLKEVLLYIKNEVLKKIICLFEAAEKELTQNTPVSKSQVEDLFEFYFAFAEYDESNHYKVLQKAEDAMAARKNIRGFKPLILNEGLRCTQCGIREPLKGNISYGYSFKKNERLCIICAGKRFLRKAFSNEAGIPSTSTITVSAWLDNISSSLDTTKLCSFHYSLINTNIPAKVTPVPKNANKNLLFKVEGDCLIPDSYSRFEKEADKGYSEVIKKTQKFLEEMLGDLKPPKYFTILHLDGDSIGEKIQSLKDYKEHQEFSLKLCDFTSYVYKTVHEEFHGYVVYYGGDEGVVLIPLSETLDVMEKLRLKFTELLKGINSLNDEDCTLSAGAAVVHHQYPLGEGLRAAKAALKRAKEVGDNNKNAFAFNIRKRSGAHLICASPWEIDGQSMINFMEEWIGLYTSDILSTRWYYQFAVIEPTVKDDEGRYNEDLTINEIYHILPRHVLPSHKSKALELSKKTGDVIKKDHTQELVVFENLLSLLQVPIFIYRGGR